MAVAAPPKDAGEEPPSLPALPLARKLSFWGFGTLVVLAVAFVLWWGLSYGVWDDNGVYAVTITLAGFGLAGMWLMTPNPPVPSPDGTGAPPPRR